MSNYNNVVAVAGSTTQVKKVVVGTPIKRVSQTGVNVSAQAGQISDFDLTGLTDGSVLVYDTASQKFVVQQTLTNTNISGGQY